MIEINNLRKSFNDNLILDNINLTIEKNDIFGLLGVSGAGKSTLLRCINGLEKFDQGSLKVDGIEVKNQSEKEMRKFRKDIGMIFQHFSLLERNNVYENVALPMKCWGYSNAEIDKRVKDLLELVELKDKIHSKPRELSGGQKQRVAIARALTMNPKLLLCDEATSALDPSITTSILQLLKKINQELKVTIIVVTHQMNVVKQVCNNMAILSKGKMEAVGKVEDIFFDNPPVLEELLGSSRLENYPSQGINIEIVARNDASRDTILAELAIATKVKYSVVWGGLDKYRDKILGYFVINIQEHDKEKVTHYLSENHVEWREV